MYRLLLTYKSNLSEGGKYYPTVPLLNRYLYDGVLEAQVWL